MCLNDFIFTDLMNLNEEAASPPGARILTHPPPPTPRIIIDRPQRRAVRRLFPEAGPSSQLGKNFFLKIMQ